MDKITWTNGKRWLADLIPWERNPREIREPEAMRLQESLSEFGQVEPTAIGPGNELYNGHQRLSAWAARFGNIEIDVRVSSRELTEKEREKLTSLLHIGATGHWNWDSLSTWDATELRDWGFSQDALKSINTDAAALRELLASQAQFDPNLNPIIGEVVYVDADVSDARDDLANKYKDNAEYVSVTCPHCGKDFFLAKGSVA